MVGKIVEEVSDLPRDIATKTGLVSPPTAPRVTPEVVPEEEPVADQTVMGRGTRRTRGKRAGQAGTLIEGYGALYKSPSSKAVGR